MRALAMSLLVLMVTGHCTKDGRMNSANHDPARASLLQSLLGASSDSAFNDLLMQHGRIQESEVPEIADSTTSWSESRRYYATQALTLAGTANAREVLRQRVKDTQDIRVWAVAIDALLESEPDLARARPELIDHALKSDDGIVLAAGLRAAAKIKHPGLSAALERALGNKDWKVRLAAAGAASGSEALLREHLGQEQNEAVLGAMVKSLGSSQDEVTWAAIQQALARADRYQSEALFAALEHAPGPRVKELLLPVARNPGPQRKLALHTLFRLPADANTVRVAVEIYEQTPPRDAPDYRELASAQEPCDKFLSQLAGRAIRGTEALSFAQKWLTSHGERAESRDRQ